MECRVRSAPSHLDAAGDTKVQATSVKNSPPTFRAMKTRARLSGGGAAERILSWCRCAPCGCGPESAGAQTEEGNGTRATGWIGKLEGVCGRHVSKYCAIQFQARITWGLRFFFFKSPKPLWKRKLTAKMRKGLHVSRWDMINYIFFGWVVKMRIRLGLCGEDNLKQQNEQGRFAPLRVYTVLAALF